MKALFFPNYAVIDSTGEDTTHADILLLIGTQQTIVLGFQPGSLTEIDFELADTDIEQFLEDADLARPIRGVLS